MKKHYGWVICAGGVLLHFCACGLVTNGLAVLLPFIKSEVGLTNTQTSMIITIRCLVSMLAMMVADAYYRKLSLRLGTSIALLFFSAGSLLFSLAGSALMCYLAAALMGIAYALGGLIPISILVRNWFQDRRSTVAAICACGSGVSAMISPPILISLVEKTGLYAAVTVAAGFVAFCSVIVFLILRDTPAVMGLEPYQEDGHQKKQKESRQFMDSDLSHWELMLLMLAMLMVGSSGTPSISNLSLHYISAGYSSIQTASAISIYGVVLIAGKFLFGVGSDRFGTYRVNYVYIGCWILALFATAAVNGASIPLLYLTALLHGIGSPVGTVGITIWVGELTSPQQYARNIQRSQMFFSMGSLLMMPFTGIIADITGSYAPTYVLFGCMITITLIIVQFIYRRHRH